MFLFYYLIRYFMFPRRKVSSEQILQRTAVLHCSRAKCDDASRELNIPQFTCDTVTLVIAFLYFSVVRRDYRMDPTGWISKVYSCATRWVSVISFTTIILLSHYSSLPVLWPSRPAISNSTEILTALVDPLVFYSVNYSYLHCLLFVLFVDR